MWSRLIGHMMKYPPPNSKFEVQWVLNFLALIPMWYYEIQYWRNPRDGGHPKIYSDTKGHVTCSTRTPTLRKQMASTMYSSQLDWFGLLRSIRGQRVVVYCTRKVEHFCGSKPDDIVVCRVYPGKKQLVVERQTFDIDTVDNRLLSWT
jgi:hypothetical protein